MQASTSVGVGVICSEARGADGPMDKEVLQMNLTIAQPSVDISELLGFQDYCVNVVERRTADISWS